MARKFTFRFEAILQVRKQQEQLSKQRFLRAQADEQAVSAAMERLAELLWKADRRVSCGLALAGGLGIDGGQMIFAPLRAGLRAHASRRHERDVLRLETARCRGQLLQDMKSHKVLGQFKARAAAAHQLKEGQAAVRESDDLHAMFSSANRVADVAATDMGGSHPMPLPPDAAAKDGRRAICAFPPSTIESLI
jgi:hypothetical protein